MSPEILVGFDHVGDMYSTYLLTPWSRVLLEKLTYFQLVKRLTHILWNPKVQYRIHKCRPPFPILSISPGPRPFLWIFRNLIRFYGEQLLAPRPTPKLEDPLSAVRDCLFNIFAATLHIGGRSSIRNLRTRHAVVTGTHLSYVLCFSKCCLCTCFRNEACFCCNCNDSPPRRAWYVAVSCGGIYGLVCFVYNAGKLLSCFLRLILPFFNFLILLYLSMKCEGWFSCLLLYSYWMLLSLRFTRHYCALHAYFFFLLSIGPR